MATTIITLLSDFGLRDPYVAEMKAVILSICADAKIVDITHEVKKFDIRMGAFILARAAHYFPEGAIHVAVVDPGVGTERRALMVQATRAFYVGPDNGLLMISALREGIRHIFEISNPRYMLKNISRTFHGRDVFSCVAAHLANGVPSSEFGPEVEDPVMPSYVKSQVRRNEVIGEVMYIDDFGNIITNISPKDLGKLGIGEGGKLKAKLKDKSLTLVLCSAYAETILNEPLSLIGSGGFLEVAINQGNAAQAYDVRVGDVVRITRLLG